MADAFRTDWISRKPERRLIVINMRNNKDVANRLSCCANPAEWLCHLGDDSPPHPFTGCSGKAQGIEFGPKNILADENFILKTGLANTTR